MATSSAQQKASFESLRKYQDSGWAYKALAQKLIKSNATWNQRDLSFLETRFPHIVLKLLDVWGSRDCRIYLNGLICDDRGDRQGFPLEALQDILMLSAIHDDLVPETLDQWGHVRHISQQSARAFQTKGNGRFSLYHVNGHQMRLDSPVTAAQMEELRQIGLMPKTELKHGTYYFGVSTKDGTEQIYRWNEARKAFGASSQGLGIQTMEELDYVDSERGFAVFIPLMEVSSPNP